MKKIFILLVLLLSNIAIGNNWYVSTSSSGNGSGNSWANKRIYTTFNWGNVVPGDVVYIDGGSDSLTYSLNEYTLEATGAVGDHIIITKGIDAGHNGTPIFLNAAVDMLWFGNSSYLTVQYIKFKGKASTSGSNYLLVFQSGVHDITIQYCSFDLRMSCGVDVEGGYNLKFLHNTIVANTITSVSTDSWHMSGAGSYDIEIAYNTVMQNNSQENGVGGHRDIIQLALGYQSDGGLTSIHHNYFNDISAGAAMACIEAHNVGGSYEIYDNIFKSNCAGLLGEGIASLISITANRAYDGENGLPAITGSVTMKLYNNTFYGTTDYVTPLYLIGFSDVDVKNNIFYQPVANAGYFIALDAYTESHTMDWDYNQYYSGNTDFISGYSYPALGIPSSWGGFDVQDYTWSQWRALGYDAHSTHDTDTPTFVNSSGLSATDYSLQDGSDGIDDGTTISFVPDDYSGTARPQGSAYDQGAFEYVDNLSSNVNLKSKIFLQGPFSANSMLTTLNQNSMLPNSQPYNSPPWNYTGNESFNSGPNATMVDWVLVELRSASNPVQVVARRAAILKNDGHLLDTDGSEGVIINNVDPGSYYIVVYHRNHLAIMSAAPVPLSLNSVLYDFTNAMNKAYGQNPMVELASGKFGMYATDGNADGIVNDADRDDVWLMQNGNMGYLEGDFNMNTGVTIHDVNQLWNINNGAVTGVP